MIDAHIHVVPPNLPGVGPLSPVLRMSDDTVATELRRQMQTAGVTHALAMGQWNAGDDEVAVDHPDTRFVLCHVGNPWVADAAEVIYKNMNVWADLSGLVVGDDGDFGTDDMREREAELAADIGKAIRYSERPNRFL